MKESYFNSYRKYLPGVFKAPEGMMVQYEEMKRNLYKQPYYRECDQEFVDEEARKFMFRSNNDLCHCKKILQGLKRSLVQVSFT